MRWISACTAPAVPAMLAWHPELTTCIRQVLALNSREGQGASPMQLVRTVFAEQRSGHSNHM